MPNRSSNEQDENVIAKSMVDSIIEETETEEIIKPSEKNPAAVALGRLGGLKGGKARAEALTAERRKAIAKKAAEARWKKD